MYDKGSWLAFQYKRIPQQYGRMRKMLQRLTGLFKIHSGSQTILFLFQLKKNVDNDAQLATI